MVLPDMPARSEAHQINNSKTKFSLKAYAEMQEDTYDCAVCGFFRICCPNLSVLKMGFRVAEEPEASAFEDFDFAEGWCALVNLSDVARGIVEGRMGSRRGKCRTMENV